MADYIYENSDDVFEAASKVSFHGTGLSMLECYEISSYVMRGRVAGGDSGLITKAIESALWNLTHGTVRQMDGDMLWSMCHIAKEYLAKED